MAAFHPSRPRRLDRNNRRSAGARSSSTSPRGRRPRVEALEDRRMLSINSPTVESDGDLLIDGSAADDSVVVSYTSQGHIQVRHESGDDSLVTIYPQGMVSIERIVFFAGAGDDYFQVDVNLPTLARMSSGNDIVVGGFSSDEIYGGPDDDIIYGRWGDDQLHGEAGDDVVDGGTGHDALVGSLGDDRLSGGAGNDSLLGGNGDDFLMGGDGNDDLRGRAGNDWLAGDAGRDILHGDGGNDMLLGGAGKDKLFGESGRDALYGEDGDDTLYGGSGNDRLYGANGGDELYGGTGDDTLDGGAGNDLLRGRKDNDNLIGGPGHDSLFGGSGEDILSGNEGNDELYGELGDDILFGNTGNDLLVGTWGNDILFGDEGDDSVSGGNGDDWVFGGDNDDTLSGGDGNDILKGGLGNDEIYGDQGADVVAGGAGNDTLEGGMGPDVLIGGRGVDGLYGELGDDVLLGGVAAFEEDIELLAALRDEWRQDASYSARVAAITSAAFSAPLRVEDTALDDGVSDTLVGGSGRDWYFRTGGMYTYDPLGRPGMGPSVVSELPPLEGFAFIDSLDRVLFRTATERLDTRVPHEGDSLKQDEHLALTELVRYDQVTHYAVADGDWTDASTWRNGVVPGDGARVLIPIGVNVRVDGEFSQRLETIRIDGRLTYATDTNTHLIVDTAVVTATGALDIGTVSEPVPRQFTARLTFSGDTALDPSTDPFLIGKGLISHGSVSIQGAETTASARVVEASAGRNWMRLAEMPKDWHWGQRVVVASSTPGAARNEERTILATFGDVLVLDRPLAHDHVAPADGPPITVANLTRNVVISSESGDINRRGHVMFMHNRDVSVRNAEFFRLGRTDKTVPLNDPQVDSDWNLVEGTGANPRARYPVHFHRNGVLNNGSPSLVSGTVVHDAPGWGYVNHSSYVNFLDNVAYDVGGAAFATEVGDEIGSFVGNVAIGSHGSGQATEARVGIQDFGHEGDGFWIQGFGVAVIDNVSSGNDGNAFAFYGRSLPDGGIDREFVASNLPDPSIANGRQTLPVGSVPVLAFYGNQASASSVGLLVQYHLESADHDQVGVFADSVFGNNTTGVWLPYSNQLTLENLVITREVSETLEERPVYGVTGNGITRNVVYDNLTVSGYYFGIDVGRTGDSVIRGGAFDNWKNIYVRPGKFPDRTLLVTGGIEFTGSSDVHMFADYRPFGGSTSFVFSSDTITLDYGPFQNQRVYFSEQAADAVPFPEALPGVDDDYVGLTSAELWARFGVAVGGRLAPSDVLEHERIDGLVARR